MPSRRELNKDKRKQRILDAATKLIAKEGVEGCTMRRLASAARLDVTTLYNLYGSKEEIFEAMRRRGARALLAEVAELPATEPLERTRAIIDATLRVTESPVDVARPLNTGSEAPTFSRRPGDGPIMSTARGLLVAELERAAVEGVLDSRIDPHLLATAILERFRVWLPLWASGIVELAELEARVHYGLAVCLLAAATDVSRAGLGSSLVDAQRRLASLMPASVDSPADLRPARARAH